ncbi:MAG: triose-phosphate isomerase [Elusimicrobia bacterium]|nr:triose-phosphate isomerase [Elusimicrobiota bacterium]
MTHSLRKPLIAGNWKMHLTLTESVRLAREVLGGAPHKVDVVLCPPFTALPAVAEVLRNSPVQLGAQDMFWESHGAYTGEVSSLHLKDVGCRYVLLGHSERRRYFGETDQQLQKKIHAAVAQNLVPILCVGETLEERQAEQTFAVLERQLITALTGFNPIQLSSLVVAYEPVWAIGTGRTATPQQAQEAHRFVRELLARQWGDPLAQSVRVLYGGSVKADNIDALMAERDLDGALVGGESLKPAAFLRIVHFHA